MNISGGVEEAISKYFVGNFESEEVDFRNLFESVPSAYLILDPDLNIVAATDLYLRLCQKELRSILKKNIFEVFPDDPKDPDATGVRNLKASLERVIQTKKLHLMAAQKYNILDPNSLDGSFLERYWQPANYPILNESDELIYIIHSVEDITNVTQMQFKASSTELINLELNDIRIFLESVLDNIPNIVFVKDGKSLKYLKINKAFENFIGSSQSEFLGKTDYDVFPKSQADVFTEQDRIVLSSGKVMDIVEEEVDTTKEGTKIVHTRKVPFRDQSKNIEYLIGISEDITEKTNLLKAQMAQKASEEMLKRKIKFLDIAAHELRTPITSLSLLIQITQKKMERGLPLTFDLLTKLKIPAERLSRLVTDLLEMSRLERGLLSLIPVNEDIVSLISKCAEDFRIQVPDRKIIFNEDNRVIEVEMDPLRINQVLSNLIDNAIKYANDSDIEIILEDKKNSVRVSVCDNGPGVPKNQIASLFTAFSRGSSDATIKTSGLGLGLSVSHGIIDLHNGHIGVDSGAKCGCTFYFELPKKMTKA